MEALLKMKKFVFIAVVGVLFSCNGKQVPDCFRNAGALIQKEFVVPEFSKIVVFDRVELILKEAPQQSVVVETGEYLMNDIAVKVEEGQLLLKDKNSCNLIRDYGLTKIYVSAPHLTAIRSSSEQTIRSEGTLSYPNLELVSEDFQGKGQYQAVGDFRLDVNCETLTVSTNNLSHMYLSGDVDRLNIGFYGGNSRFEGRHLRARQVNFYQRSSNDLILNVQESLTGEIRSTGNVILVHEPPYIEVRQFYTGQLLIE